jgi:threonine aldolase
MHPIELRSDNCAGAAPEIMAALAAADAGSALAYGGDDHTAHLRALVRDVFGCPEAEVFPVLSGTAANALGLAALCPPWGSVLCHETAHIYRSECGATSMFGAGAVMRGLPAIAAAGVAGAFAARTGPAPLAAVGGVAHLPTDMGTVLGRRGAGGGRVAAGRGLRVTRPSLALVALGCSPRELLTDSGVSVFSLGATKNGALSTDAIVSLDPAVSEQLVYRVKRAGHVASKMRHCHSRRITDGLWLRLARQANDAMAALSAGLRDLGVEFLAEPHANMLFARVGSPAATALAAEGLLFYEMGDGIVRFVTSWQTTEADVHEILRRATPALTH